MAKSVASKKRTLSIMEALLEKSDEAHRLSTNDLLEMLEREGISTNRKSIYDDIETLKEWDWTSSTPKKSRRDTTWEAGSLSFRS